MSVLKHRYLQLVQHSYVHSKAATSSCKPSLARIHIPFTSLPHGHQNVHLLSILGQNSGRVCAPVFRLSLTVATRLLYFRSACAVTHPLRQAACILSRRHELPGRLGAIAAAGAGFVRAIGSRGAGNGQFKYPSGGVAFVGEGKRFDGEGNLVVSDCENHRIQVFCHIDGAHLRTIGSEGAGNGQLQSLGNSV